MRRLVEGMRIGGKFLALALTVLVSTACSDRAQKPAEAFGTARAAVISLGPPTSVQSGTPSPRAPKCPGGQLPDQCGSWAGVELRAARAGGLLQGAEDEHCLCDAIDFRIPAELPVTEGKSGWDWDKATLSFRTATGSQVECRYHGNGHPLGKYKGIPARGDKYLFEYCSDGSKPNQTRRSDWFELGLGAIGGSTVVQLRLGEPDVVGGIVQEQVFYSTDPRIPGAALHVPRGTAPAFESFSLSVLNEVPLGTFIPNANESATTISLVVDVRAASTDTFAFTPVPGAACPRIELPYDPATLEQVAGPAAEDTIRAQQLTTLAGITSGAEVLSPAGAVAVDLTRRTFSFCVEHLSFWVGTSGAYDATLVTANIRGLGFPSGFDALSGQPLPSLVPGQSYHLTLGFEKDGGNTWRRLSNIYLVGVGEADYPAPPSTDPPTVRQLPPDPVHNPQTVWQTAPSTNDFSPSNVFEGGTATFQLDIVCPSTAVPLNFCMRDGTSLDRGYFGDCFSWDKAPMAGDPPAPLHGTTPVALPEACDGLDNDGDGDTDEDTIPCYSGPAGTEGQAACRAGTASCIGGVWGACTGEVVPIAESCNGLDDDCDGSIDEGTFNACGGCGVLDNAPGTACQHGLGDCARSGIFRCSSPNGTLCDAPVIAPGTEVCNGLDDDCDGSFDEVGCPATTLFIGTSAGFNSALVGATISTIVGGSLPATNLLATTPTLVPGESYELVLQFIRSGGTTNWVSGTSISLVPVVPPFGSPPTVVALPSSPWGVVATNQFVPLVIAIGDAATFVLELTTPATASPLNLCLRQGPSDYFGECFVWTPTLEDICDGIDNDGDGSIDEDCVAHCATVDECGVCDGDGSTCAESCALWVLSDSDPDYQTPPFNDRLFVLDGDGGLLASVATLNTSEAIGAQRAISVLRDGKTAFITDWVQNQLHRFALDGGTLTRTWSAPIIDPIAVSTSRAGVPFVLSGETIDGVEILRLDPVDGSIEQSAPIGGFDLVVDDDHDAIWVVGSSIRKLGTNLQQAFMLDPIAWSATSVDYATDGSVWIAERGGPVDRLLHVTPDGQLSAVIPLPFSPSTVGVDRRDDSVWVGGFGTAIEKYDADGNLVLHLPYATRSFSLQVSQQDGSIWVAGESDAVSHFSEAGILITTVPGESSSLQTRLALANHCGEPE